MGKRDYHFPWLTLLIFPSSYNIHMDNNDAIVLNSFTVISVWFWVTKSKQKTTSTIQQQAAVG